MASLRYQRYTLFTYILAYFKIFIFLGHCVVQPRILFLPMVKENSSPASEDAFLAYVERFNFMGYDKYSDMHIVKRAYRTDGSPIGDIIPVSQFRTCVELTPKFGMEADKRLTMTTCLEYNNEFRLNKYFTKELFSALSTT